MLTKISILYKQTNNKREDAEPAYHIYSNLENRCSPSLDRCPLVYTYTSLGILRVYPSSGHFIMQANMMDCLVVNCITCALQFPSHNVK